MTQRNECTRPATRDRYDHGGRRRSGRAPSTRLRFSAAGIKSAMIAVFIAIASAAPTRAAAQVEVEADPFAYVLNGFSLHVAGILGDHRLSIGTFGIDVPRFFHADEDWSIVMRGVGVKWDLLGASLDGFFVGADANYFRMAYTLDETGAMDRRHEFSLGLRSGYRLPVGRSRAFIVPWVGVGYTFNGGDVEIANRIFEHKPITIFPTVHIGWRF